MKNSLFFFSTRAFVNYFVPNIINRRCNNILSMFVLVMILNLDGAESGEWNDHQLAAHFHYTLF
jgi:hypothetical protein